MPKPTNGVAHKAHIHLQETFSRRSKRHRTTRRWCISTERSNWKRMSHRADRRAARNELLELLDDVVKPDVAIVAAIDKLIDDVMSCVQVSTDGGRTFVPHYYAASAFVYERDIVAIDTIWGDDDAIYIDEDGYLTPDDEDEPACVIPHEPLSLRTTLHNLLYAA